MIVASVLVVEDLPDMVWSVRVDGEIIATFKEADEDVLAWYPVDSNEPEYLTTEQAVERIKSYGPAKFVEFK